MFVRARRAAPLLAALALLAAGCGSSGGSKPVSLPTVSHSSSTSTSTSPTTAPANDTAAVEASVRRYFALVNARTSTASATGLYAIMTTDCPCRRVPESIGTVAKRHQHYFGGSRITALRATVDGPRIADTLVQYDLYAGGIKDAAGRTVASEPGRTGVTVVFRLVKPQTSWLIARIETIAEGKKA